VRKPAYGAGSKGYGWERINISSGKKYVMNGSYEEIRQFLLENEGPYRLSSLTEKFDEDSMSYANRHGWFACCGCRELIIYALSGGFYDPMVAPVKSFLMK
jgi:hypothetical protein